MMDQHHPEAMWKEPDRRQRDRYFLEALRVVPNEEHPRRDTRQPPLYQAVFRMHVFDRIFLVPGKRIRELLVFRRDVEKSPVDVPGEAGEVVSQPTVVVGDGEPCTSRPCLVDRTEPCCVPQGTATQRRIHNVGQWQAAFGGYSGLNLPFAQRIVSKAWATIGVCPVEWQRGERHRVGGAIADPIAVAEDIQA